MPVNCMKVFLALALVDRFLAAGALAVYESPAEVLYGLTGSNITLSWIVRKTYQNFAPKVIIYAKEPSTLLQTERILVSFEGNDVKIIPDGSKQSIKFSPNQLELVTSDATLPGITEELIKYSLVIRNLSDNQENTYMFEANYRVDLATSAGTRLIVTEPPSFVVNVTYRERIIREGTNFTENCATVGELGMSVKWIKDEFLVAKEGINSSTLTISNIDRSQDGMYSCVGTNNLTTIRRWINISVIYLDYNCSAQFVDGRIILKTSATGRPPVTCHPRLCPSRIDFTAERSTSWTQVFENGLIRHSCNITKAVYDARMKCPGQGRSLELNFTWFSYAFRDDKNTMTFFSDVGGNATMKGLLYVDGMLKYRDNRTFDLKPDDDPRARKFFENACRLKGNGGQSTKLSGGTIAGIVIGVAVLVIVIIFGLYCFWPKKA